MTEERRRRNSMRDPRIDYSRGNFFITICLEERIPRFRRVFDGQLEPNSAGRMIERHWLSLAASTPGLVLDCHIVMPDHFHAVLALVETNLTHPGHSGPRPDLSDVVRVFKSQTSREYGLGVRDGIWTPYDGKFWQPGFWDHQLESDADIQFHREYVVSNPQRWHLKRLGLM